MNPQIAAILARATYSGVWQGDWSLAKRSPIDAFMLENSDVISFHCYDPVDKMMPNAHSDEHCGHDHRGRREKGSQCDKPRLLQNGAQHRETNECGRRVDVEIAVAGADLEVMVTGAWRIAVRLMPSCWKTRM